MNRELICWYLTAKSVPRMRGDEPDGGDYWDFHGHVFPACAGMNRLSVS